MMTLTPVPFFSEDILLNVHTATCREHVGREMTLREFAQGGPLNLCQIGTRDTRHFIAHNAKGQSIEGYSV